MRLREFFAEDAINLQLQSTTKDDVLKELVGLLTLASVPVEPGKANVAVGDEGRMLCSSASASALR